MIKIETEEDLVNIFGRQPTEEDYEIAYRAAVVLLGSFNDHAPDPEK